MELEKTPRYNGWTNYETWRIALELFDGYQMPDDINSVSDAAEHLRVTAEEILCERVG